jgi:hypothetical protein
VLDLAAASLHRTQEVAGSSPASSIRRTLAFEALIDDERRENAFGTAHEPQLLVETPGGFDFTDADCQGWLHEAGFRETYVQHLVGPDSMAVGIK